MFFSLLLLQSSLSLHQEPLRAETTGTNWSNIHYFLSLAISLAEAPEATATPSPWGFPAPKRSSSSGKTCTVYALGDREDDTPQILAAFKNCNNGGTVIFPEGQNYWISTKLNLALHVSIEWKGIWTVRALFEESFSIFAGDCTVIAVVMG